jgi:drug/metabolite transporter (DMT)-like permease
VAVLIGHFAAGEALTVPMLLAMAAIVGAVVLIVFERGLLGRR